MKISKHLFVFFVEKFKISTQSVLLNCREKANVFYSRPKQRKNCMDNNKETFKCSFKYRNN